MSIATEHPTMELPTTGSGSHGSPDTILPGSNVTITSLEIMMIELEAANAGRADGYVTPIGYMAARGTAEALAYWCTTEPAVDDLSAEPVANAAPAPVAPVATEAAAPPRPSGPRHAADRAEPEVKAEVIGGGERRARHRMSFGRSVLTFMREHLTSSGRRERDAREIQELAVRNANRVRATLRAVPTPAETIDNSRPAPTATRRPNYTAGTFGNRQGQAQPAAA